MGLLTTFLILCVFGLMTWYAWRSRFNPALTVLVAWTPALLVVRTPYYFISTTYAELNAGVALVTDLVIAVSFLSFLFGCLAVPDARARLARWGDADQVNSAHGQASDFRLALLFALGFGIFVYAYQRAGLSSILAADAAAEDIRETRLAFHLGPISHLVLLIDIAYIVFLAKFLETRRALYLVAPILVALGYMATLQKSRVMFMCFSSIYLCFLYPRAARDIFLGTVKRRLASAGLVLMLLGLMILSNVLRGMNLFRNMDYESPILEQLFIYSGGAAILNFSALFEGRIGSDPASMGVILFRTIFWPFVERDTLNPARYLEGINNGTALVFYWQDFGVLGLPLLCFILGMLITICYVVSTRRTIFGLTLGCVAFNSAVFSVYTDVMFEPATFILLVFALLVQFTCGKRPAQPGRGDALP